MLCIGAVVTLGSQKWYRDSRRGEGRGERELISNPTHCHHQNDFRIKRGKPCEPFECFIHCGRGKSQLDSVHQSQFLKRKVSRSGESNLRPSAYHRAERLNHQAKPAHLGQKRARPTLSAARFKGATLGGRLCPESNRHGGLVVKASAS